MSRNAVLPWPRRETSRPAIRCSSSGCSPASSCAGSWAAADVGDSLAPAPQRDRRVGLDALLAQALHLRAAFVEFDDLVRSSFTLVAVLVELLRC